MLGVARILAPGVAAILFSPARMAVADILAMQRSNSLQFPAAGACLLVPAARGIAHQLTQRQRFEHAAMTEYPGSAARRWARLDAIGATAPA
jgi:hypothetical protein